MADPKTKNQSTRPTILDVARQAGVAISTASIALRGKPNVNPGTRLRVQKAAEQLGYWSNPVAQRLRSGKTGVIGLVFRPSDAIHGSLEGAEYFTKIMAGVSLATLNRDRGLLLPNVQSQLADWATPMIDGCIIVSPFSNDELLSELLKRRVPVVSIDSDPQLPAFTEWVGRDDVAGVSKLLHHLGQQGADRIALIVGADSNSWNTSAARAYTKWTLEHPPYCEVVVLPEHTGKKGAYDAAEKLLQGKNKPDAIITSTGRAAIGVMQKAKEGGISVPDQLMVAALVDSEALRQCSPPITTLDLQPEALGRAAAERILAIIEDSKANDHRQPQVMDIALHVRKSTQRR